MPDVWLPARRCREWTRRFFALAEDFLIPPVCLWCGGEDGLPAGSDAEGRGSPFCEGCRGVLAPAIPSACRRCGAPVGPFLEGRPDCRRCRADRFYFDQLIRLGIYEGALRQAILRAKQPAGESLAAGLALLLWERDADALKSANCDLVTAAPSYWGQQIWRGQHASETLGRVLAGCLQVDFAAHILRKVRATPAQASLSPTARRANLRDAFRVRLRAACRGARVLLVDDVLTTGTTANRLSALLKEAGAESVAVALLARGIGA